MKKHSLLLLLGLSTCMGLVSCGTGPSDSSSYTPIQLQEGKENVWLDRYEEADVPVVSNGETLTYVTSDARVVTIENGRLMAQGKGEATVTVSDSKTTLSIHVKVRDSGVKPMFAFRSIEGYLNEGIALPQEVSYNGKSMKTDITYQVEIADSSLATYENGKLKGKALGKTTANITSNYKGLTLKKTNIPVEIKEALYLTSDSTEIELHAVNSKLGRYTLNVNVLNKGEKVDHAEIAYSILEGTEHVRLEGSTIYAISVGDAKLRASYSAGGHSTHLDFNVHVGPNYVEEVFTNPSPRPIRFELTEDHPAGRDNVYAYQADKGVNSSNCWETHVVASRINEKIVDLYREGKRYFAYDLYYTSNQNLMVGCQALTSWISVGDYFRKDYLTILKDGKVTNVLEKNTWVTLVYDLKGLWSTNIGLPSYFFFFVNDATTTQYLANARYYLDDSFLPSENRFYEKKEGYVQASNDEFDVSIPTSKNYIVGKEEPGLVVDPNEVPEYGASEKPLAGREGAYSYKTKIASSAKNALVVATSMNETYDDSLYRLSKLGKYLSFDIYPTQESVLSFSINDGAMGYEASLVVGESSLSSYENWLIVYSGNERLNTLKANQWQTVVLAFNENYNEKSPSGQIKFSSGTQNDEVYVDNVRFYQDSAFIPTAYALEDRRPIAGDASTTVERVSEGTMRGNYEIKGSNVAFNGVSDSGAFFQKGSRYVKFDLYLGEGTESISLHSHATTGLIAHDIENLVVGEALPESLQIFDENGVKSSSLSVKKWYSFYVFVETDGNAVTGCDVSLRIKGNGTSYARYVNFVDEIHGLYLRNMAGISEHVSLEYQRDGEFKGAYRYENGTSGDIAGNAQNWGESGVRFDTVSEPDDGGPGSFFQSGYHWIKVDVYVQKGMHSFSIRSTADRNFTNYWVQDIPVDSALPSNVYALTQDGNRASALRTNRWYSLLIPVQYTGTDTGYTCVTLYSNGGSKASPSVMYLKNIEYYKTFDIPKAKPAAVLGRGDFGNLVSCVEEDGVYTYSNATPGEVGGNNQNWGESGIYFHNVTNPSAATGADSCGSFFKDGYHFVKTDVYFETCESFSIKCLGQNGFTNYWKREIGFGKALESDVYLYNVSGERVTSISKNTWYTLYIPVAYTEGYSDWTEVTIYTNGGSVTNPSVMKLNNVEFLKEFKA